MDEWGGNKGCTAKWLGVPLQRKGLIVLGELFFDLYMWRVYRVFQRSITFLEGGGAGVIGHCTLIPSVYLYRVMVAFDFKVITMWYD